MSSQSHVPASAARTARASRCRKQASASMSSPSWVGFTESSGGRGSDACAIEQPAVVGGDLVGLRELGQVLAEPREEDPLAGRRQPGGRARRPTPRPRPGMNRRTARRTNPRRGSRLAQPRVAGHPEQHGPRHIASSRGTPGTRNARPSRPEAASLVHAGAAMRHANTPGTRAPCSYARCGHRRRRRYVRYGHHGNGRLSRRYSKGSSRTARPGTSARPAPTRRA